MNENEYTDAAGVRYVAKANRDCMGCAHKYAGDPCVDAPPCGSGGRSDGRPIIWVKAEVAEGERG